MNTRKRKWAPVIAVLMMIQAVPGFSQEGQRYSIYAGTDDVLPLVQAVSYTKVPFELVDGLIFVKAEVEGQWGNFILDTGAPSLIINGENMKGGTEEWQGITDDIKPHAITVNQFSWAGIEKKGIEAIGLDISHLEEAYQRKVLGIIGYQIFSDREILVNPQTKQIIILDGKKNYLNRITQPISTIPFTIEGHLPVISAKAGSRTFRFGFDSGCTSNLLDQKVLDQLSGGAYEIVGHKQLQGFAEEPREVQVISTSAITFENLPIQNTTYLVTGLSHLEESGIHIDGFLGYPFFKGLAFSINYASNQLSIWGIHGEEAELIP
ncbi:MAG: aspartyl protease family protein [Lewinellaceae bacterium]|nr:aspartyl protease family protein [Lewinellaceae bacterium]